MRIAPLYRLLLIAPLVSLVAPRVAIAQADTQFKAISVFIVRHAESDSSKPTIPLSEKGRQRAALLAPTLQGVKFTHIFTTHTTRTRQMVEAISEASGLAIVQLPAPGSLLDGQPVGDQTSRRVAIDPMGEALLKIPPGSVALVAANSENIFAILNKLGVPVAAVGQSCERGSMCVPCTDNSCFPRNDFDRIWHLVRISERREPIALVEFRYGEGWRSSEK